MRPAPLPYRCLTMPARLLGVVLAWALLSAPAAHGASFQVSPTRFVFSLDQRFTDFFTVTNNSDRPLRIRVYPQFMAVDDDGRLTPAEEHPHDLSAWIVFNPRALTLRPLQRRVVRFSVRPPADLETGEYRTVVFFEELPPQRSAPAGQQDGGERRMGVQLRLLTRVGVTLYGMQGERRYGMTFQRDAARIDREQVALSGRFHNTGNAHVPLTIDARLVAEGGGVVHEERSRLVVQRDSWRPWRFVAPRPAPGQYHLRLVGTHDQLKVIEQTVPVEVGSLSGD